MDNRITPPWAVELTEGEFISYAPTYKVGEWFHLYEKRIFESVKVGDMVYYFYDPTKNGYPADKKYPLLIFLHASNT